MQEFKKVLGNKNYFLLWLGQAISEVGTDVCHIGLIWLVIGTTGSATSVSLLFVMLIMPSIVFGPWAGVLVDKWNKKKVIVVTDITRGLIALAMALSIDNLSYLYLLAFADFVLYAFFSPAIKTAIPRLVARENLMTANSLYMITRQGAGLIGPAVGGALIGLFGVQILFFLNGVSFLLSAALEMGIRMPVSGYETLDMPLRIKEKFKEGLDYIKQRRVVIFVIIFFAIATIPMGGLAVLNVVLFREVFNYTAEQYGLLMSMKGAGLILGSIFMGKWGKNILEIKAIVTASFFMGLFYMALALSGQLFFSVLFFSLAGFFGSMIGVAYYTFLQKIVDENVRGRVFSIDIAIGNVLGLLAMAAVGPLADNFNPALIYAVGGLILVALGLGTNFLKVYAGLIEEYREALRAG